MTPHTCQHCEFYTTGECTNPVVTDTLSTTYGGDCTADDCGLTVHFSPRPEFSCSGYTPFITRQRERTRPESMVDLWAEYSVLYGGLVQE